MKKTLTALTLGIALGALTLETLAGNPEKRVSLIATDSRAIKSESSGRIPISKDMCIDLAIHVPLLGKLAHLYGYSPFVYGTNSMGETVFSDTHGTISTIEYSKDRITENGIIKEIEIRGKRPYVSNFKAYMKLDCEKNGQEVEYKSTMYIVVEDGFRRFIINGLRCLPLGIEETFKEEQDRVGKMMGNLAKEMSTRPKELLQKAKESKELTPQEEYRLEENMRKHGFLK